MWSQLQQVSFGVKFVISKHNLHLLSENIVRIFNEVNIDEQQHVL